MADSTRRNIYLPDDLWKEVVEACEAEQEVTGERIAASMWIRRAIRDYLIQKGRV